MDYSKPILLFDGLCGLCNRSVNFVMDHDPEATIFFAAMQSEAGEYLLKKFSGRLIDMDSVLLLEKGELYDRSDAVIRLAGYLRGPVRLLSWGWLVPRFLRDALYDFVAARRYRWFGGLPECRVPDTETRYRFLVTSRDLQERLTRRT